MISVGDIVGGRYRLLRQIGEGGMASVWLADDNTLLREVAIKFVWARDHRRQDTLVNSFLREARLAASVVHHNVVQVLDFGLLDDQTPFMVMEALKGETLGDLFNAGAQFDLHEIVQITSRSLEGLIAVHQAGIVHRDLKPENIFLIEERDGYFPKLLDFGISRSLDQRSGLRSAVTTRDGRIVGTPEYMSPEQAAGTAAVDRRTDIYSMGVIIYETITGDVPYKSNHMGDLIIKITRGEARPISELVPEIGQELSDVVAKAMHPVPSERFADATEMSRAFMNAANAALRVLPRSGILPDRATDRRQRTQELSEDQDAGQQTRNLPGHLRPAPEPVVKTRTIQLDSGEEVTVIRQRTVRTAVLWLAAAMALIAAAVGFVLVKFAPAATAGNKFIVVQGSGVAESQAETGAPVQAPGPTVAAAATSSVAAAASDAESSAGGAPQKDAAAAQAEAASVKPKAERRPATRKRKRKKTGKGEVGVARDFSRQMSPVVRCFEHHSGKDLPQLSLRITIDQGGKVVESLVFPAEYDSTSVGGCVRKAVASMRFAPQSSKTAYRVPLIARRGS